MARSLFHPHLHFLDAKNGLKCYSQAGSLPPSTTGCCDLIFVTHLPDTLQGLEIIF